MRNRLTSRVAADTVADKGTGIMNDPYQVNNPEHEKNDPEMSSYVIGDPEKFGEGVNKDDLWKKDKRDPGTHIPEITAKMAADAIKAGRNLEEKAVKCIVASQRILPGAVDAVIESQAADLMQLPDTMINSLLSRQEDLANSIAKAAEDTSEKVEEKEEKEEKDEKDASKACKKEDEESEEVDASKACKKDDEDEEVEAAAKKLEELQASVIKLAGEIPAALKAYQEAQKAKKGEKPEEKEEEKDAGAIPEGLKKFQEEQKAKKGEKPEEDEKDAGKKVEPAEEKKEEEEVKDAAKKEEKKPEEEITFGDTGEGEGKDASQNLLDDIFSSVIASDTKKGAKSLSGLVKKEASEAKDPLDVIWNAPPDVSSHFQ
jgi:chemotaxis protein histidine kinase CheA